MRLADADKALLHADPRMKVGDFLISLAGFYEPATTALRREWVTETRTTHLRARLPMSRDDARAIAKFSLGGWARNYPVMADDLGEGFALFVAEWLLAHALEPSAENMDTALREWEGGMFYGRMCAAIAGY